jgi:hypothetical protein
MKIKFTIIFLILCNLCFSQKIKYTEPKLTSEINTSSYSIYYPSNWKIDNSGTRGTSFFLFSEKTDTNDDFIENINLLIQNLEKMNIDLNKFVEISEGQIINNGNLIESKRLKKNGIECQQLIYEMRKDKFHCKLIQYYFIKNEKAYVLTFCGESNVYEKYIPTAKKIMDSFKVK